jgi:hypothetical protein
MGADEHAQTAAGAALDLAERIGDSATLGYALVGKAFALPSQEIDARRSFISRAIDSLEASGEAAYCGRAYALLAEIEFESGNVAQALQSATAAIKMFVNMGLPHFAPGVQTNIPMYLNAMGRYDESLAAACDLLPIEIKYGQATTTLWTLLHAATAAAHLNELDNAAKLLGFCERALIDRNISAWQTDAREAEELTEFLRAHLDDEKLALLLCEGEAMSDSEAVALALSLPSRCLPAREQSTTEPALAQ